MPRDCSVEVVEVVRSEDVDGEGMSRRKFIQGERAGGVGATGVVCVVCGRASSYSELDSITNFPALPTDLRHTDSGQPSTYTTIWPTTPPLDGRQWISRIRVSVLAQRRAILKRAMLRYPTLATAL